MGRKRNWTWEYLYFSVACMIFISSAGCAILKEIEAQRETREYLITAQRLLDRGDYEGALKDNQKVISLYPHAPPGDEALFYAAVIYAHYGYSKRDYQKSLDYFKRLVKVFPHSPFVGQAKIWIEILQENAILTRETEDANKSLGKTQQENERLNSEIDELRKTLMKSKQVDIEIDEKKKEISK